MIRVAIAPFVWEGASGEMAADAPVQIARVLAERLADRPIDRVMSPDAFLARAEFEPPAATIRQWAYNASVDTVIVGRVRALDVTQQSKGWQLEAILRSGHSGAESNRHRITVTRRADIEDSLDRLAAEILEDLGFTASEEVATAPHRDPRSPEPPAFAAASAAPQDETNPGLAADFDLGRLREDAPIEINAEEAEIVDRGDERKLVFQRNVRVRQGDVRLESDVLEAEYRKGEPEPDRLVARGSVQVDQGYRRAKCDRAVYSRVDQKLSCEGRAELVQGCDVVRGDSIEFDLAGDEAHVVGAASVVIRPTDGQGDPCASPEDRL
jgi:lipopolysaccharide export system protein LptA